MRVLLLLLVAGVASATAQCCRAMTVQCLSCNEGLTQGQFCSQSPRRVDFAEQCAKVLGGHPDVPPSMLSMDAPPVEARLADVPLEAPRCCKAMKAECLSCLEGLTVAEFCANRRLASMVPPSDCADAQVVHAAYPPLVTRLVDVPSADPKCCKAMRAECLSCVRGISVDEFCANPRLAATVPPGDCATARTVPAVNALSLIVADQTVTCYGPFERQCLQTKVSRDEEFTVFYDYIQGFDFEPGYEYELQVEVATLTDPVPMDASSQSYKLLALLSKTKTATVDFQPDLHVKTMQDQSQTVCCRSLALECQACSAGMTEDEFCAKHPSSFKVPECADRVVVLSAQQQPEVLPATSARCCKAMKLECLACVAGTSEAEFCANPALAAQAGPECDRLRMTRDARALPSAPVLGMQPRYLSAVERTSSSMVMTWAAPEDLDCAGTYEVRYRIKMDAKKSEWVTVERPKPSDTVAVLTNLSPSHIYQIEVTPIHSDGTLGQRRRSLHKTRKYKQL